MRLPGGTLDDYYDERRVPRVYARIEKQSRFANATYRYTWLQFFN